ncbi:MAG TPA: sugar phosphate isomerase/epimerase [Nitrososphaerales archaeon]|nr:sugar phosphate isomerase/epimerase [Nitrososphaerales archaeon]
MKLGVSTWSLLGMDVYDAVETIGEAGLEYVELWGEVPHAFPAWTDKMRLKDALSPYKMVVTTHAPFTDLNPASPFQPVKSAVEKTLEDFVEFSAFLGASMTTVHPGSVHNEQLVPQSVESSVAVLRKMVKASGGRLSVNIENQSKSTSKYHYPLGSTTESVVQILDRTETGCTIDTGHAHASGLDPMELAKGVGKALREIHLSDNAGQSDDHLIPGRGTAPLSAFLESVRESDVLVCLEINPHRYAREEVLGSVAEAKALLQVRGPARR